MALDRAQLMNLSQAELDDLFKRSSAGNIPEGEGSGTALVCPATCCGKIIAWFARWFCWQGKVFHGKEGWLVNRVSPFSFQAIKAKVYQDKSWLDGNECIVLDYSKTSLVAKMVRDEIREVAPGLYLGKVYWGRKRLIDFMVSFQYEPARKCWRRTWATLGLLGVIVITYLGVRLTSDRPVTYDNLVEHFKYGSTGGERTSGIPISLWKVIPKLFAGYLPGNGLQSLGFVYEEGKEFPIGTSRRTVQGIDRIFLNCAVCHVGTVRDTAESKPRIIVGMPANTVDLQAFQRFLSACAADENFNAKRIMDEVAKQKTDDRLNRVLLRFLGIDLMRQRLLTLRQRFTFMDREPDYGPGRVDTFNAPKVLLNFRMDNLPTNEWVGICDFPSVWNQRKRKGMHLHWDGNNDSVEERNRSASFGTGATPPTLDRASIKRMEEWLLDAAPPPYPYSIDRALVTKGEPLYLEYCARCHGKNGSDFTGELVGKVTPIEEIKTDRHRLDSYSSDLCANQNLLYAAYPEDRFKHFRKTFGYANQPLDGLWLRAPYLHNGSVPTLRDLLEPTEQRPKVFYRGYDVYEAKRVGFVSNVAQEGPKKFFNVDTELPGNGNFGHDGKEYGTDLSAEDKDAIVEYMKTF